ncbi:uncharacterized protein TNCV_2642071 [Trichonephila clavipes]|nr:uncharacterized protein TNCV_2642071 [Trichonephila clavipes]
MDVCKCIVPLRHGCTLNSRQATSTLVWLVEGCGRSLTTPGVLPQNWGGNEPNCSVTCMVLKATANDRRHLALSWASVWPSPIRMTSKKLIMGHEDELTIEELQETLIEEHQETQRNVSPEEEEDERGQMPTSAIEQWS